MLTTKIFKKLLTPIITVGFFLCSQPSAQASNGLSNLTPQEWQLLTTIARLPTSLAAMKVKNETTETAMLIKLLDHMVKATNEFLILYNFNCNDSEHYAAPWFLYDSCKAVSIFTNLVKGNYSGKQPITEPQPTETNNVADITGTTEQSQPETQSPEITPEKTQFVKVLEVILPSIQALLSFAACINDRRTDIDSAKRTILNGFCSLSRLAEEYLHTEDSAPGTKKMLIALIMLNILTSFNDFSEHENAQKAAERAERKRNEEAEIGWAEQRRQREEQRRREEEQGGQARRPGDLPGFEELLRRMEEEQRARGRRAPADEKQAPGNNPFQGDRKDEAPHNDHKNSGFAAYDRWNAWTPEDSDDESAMNGAQTFPRLANVQLAQGIHIDHKNQSATTDPELENALGLETPEILNLYFRDGERALQERLKVQLERSAQVFGLQAAELLSDQKAADEKIKKEWRKLSLQHHPDKNIGDEGAATERIKNIGVAKTKMTTELEDLIAKYKKTPP